VQARGVLVLLFTHMTFLSPLPASLSSALGIVFALLGIAAVWLIFDASRRTHSTARRERIIRAHRVAGYAFIALFCLLVWLMLLRTGNSTEELPVRSTLHILMALVLVPLLLVKVLVARYYKSFTSVLVPLGLMIFTLAFVLVGSSAGPYLLRSSMVKRLSLQDTKGIAEIDLSAAEQITLKRCSRCHALERVMGARKDAGAWLGTINRMRTLPGSGISDTDATIILSYLIAENSIDSSNTRGALSVGRALVDTHCARCHNLDRVYESRQSPEYWSTTVQRMVDYASGTDGFFKPGESDRIIQFLSATQTPEAAAARLSVASDAVREGPTPVQKEPAAQGNAPSGASTLGVLAILVAGFGTLIWRRPKTPSMEAHQPAPSIVKAAQGSFLLRLVRIERQTHNCVSLRFRVAEPDAFRAKPGQFLTFDWLIDGEKLVRSYSISSSPTQAGFIEITVKQAEQGRVSTFLNERVPSNLTVEARGPAGRFCFDEKQHHGIVLFAGGSGITPMMSMLRYIDDLCLDTKVTLFYSVRTQRDVIFERELDDLQERLPNFQRLIVPTQPDQGWAGPSGRLGREMLIKAFDANDEQTFFLCGPEPFMNHVDSILQSLGVSQSRILREVFGGKRATPHTALETTTPMGSVEFARSDRVCEWPSGRTLLEVAEMNGINIPYSCRQGQCGTCATRLLDGQIKMDCEDGLQPALKSQGYVLTCVARGDGSIRLDA
jgi:ferredoxin-NADP reductase/mono/diheme cytochrome c family protein